MKKLFLSVLVLAMIAGGWFAVTRGIEETSETSGIEERYVAEAARRDINFHVEVSGDVAPAVQLEIKSEVGGKLKALHAQPGNEVKSGDLLAAIDDTDLLTEKAGVMTEIEGARLAVEKTQRNFQRSKELFESKLISREVYDNLASDLAIAENNLTKAERRLEAVEDKLRKTLLYAPTGGTVLSVPVTHGQVVVAAASVNSGTTLMTIADLSRLLVDTHVNQVDITKIRPGQLVNLKSSALGEDVVRAEITFIAPVASVKNNIKGFEVEAAIEHPDPRLRPGMTVRMDIPVANVEQAVAVPISAVFLDEANEEVVYVVKGQATEKRGVSVGVSDLQFAEILSGLEPGERILLVRPDDFRKQT